MNPIYTNGGNAWYPRFNGRGDVAFGNGSIGVRFADGRVVDRTTPGRNTYQGGYGDDDSLLVAVLRDSSGSSDLGWMDPTTGAIQPIQILPPTNNFVAGPGRHWAATCSGNIWLDGVVLEGGGGRPMALSQHPDGRTALVINCGDALRYYLGGVRQLDDQGHDVLPRPTDTNIDLFAFVYPIVDLGYGKPYRVNVEARTCAYVGAFPKHNECHAAPYAGGIVTAGAANGKLYLCGRQPGASQGQVIELAAATDVAALGTLVAVNDRGSLALYDIPVTYPVTPIPVEGSAPVDPPPAPEPAGPDPVIASFGRRVRNGCYYRDTYTDQRIVNGKIDAQGADCPGNVTWCVSGEPRAALTADKDSLTGEPIGLIVGDDAISLMATTPGYWDRIQAIYLSPESAADPLAALLSQIEDVKYRCAHYDKPLPPIIPYIGLTPAALAALDGCGAEVWFPVQLYINGTQGPDDVRALADSLHAIVENRKVAFICQAFARWTGRTPDTAAFKGNLTALMPVYADIVRAWGEQVEAVGFFSWRRMGGALDYPQLKPWLRAFARASQ